MAENKKVFDVAKPGKSAPSENARPIIITHKSIAQDPMMAKSTDRDEVAKSAPPVSSRGIMIEPPKEAKAEQASSQKVAVKSADEPVQKKPDADAPSEATETEKQAAEPAPGPTVEKPAEVPQPTESEVEEKAEPDIGEKLPEEQGNSDLQAVDQAKKKAAEEKKAADEAKIQHLVEERKYFVPIGSRRKRSAKKAVVILIVLLILAVVAVDLLVDAGIIKTSFKPVVDLIPN